MSTPDVATVPSRARRLLPWLVLGLMVWLVAGPLVAGVAGGVALWHLALRPPPRHLLLVSVVLFAAVPVAWVLGNAERLDTVSPQLVTQNPWPSVLAATALLLLAVGVVREVRTAEDGRDGRGGRDGRESTESTESTESRESMDGTDGQRGAGPAEGTTP